MSKPTPQQTELEMVTLEQLVPGDHLLRKVDAAINFPPNGSKPPASSRSASANLF
ncbi:hypothetical protein [Roseovarius sp. E0-M6]|uniref:hypothetical protein n=1 Tax=Roseovarius sp. E0-M6 TaxID=3127118 RepID=UPI00300F8A79